MIASTVAALSSLLALSSPLLPEADCRARVVAFLTRGPAPPRRLLTRTAERRLRATPVDDPVHGACFSFRFVQRKRVRLTVRVERRTGRVVALDQPDRGLHVPWVDREGLRRSRAERLEEIRRRALPRAALRRQAWAALRQLYPALERRRFVLRRERLDADRVRVVRRYVFEERAGPGVLALYPNRARLALDPATGVGVSLQATQLSLEVRAPPTLTSAGAVREARRLLDLPGAKARARLRVIRVRPGRLRVVWAVRVRERPRPLLLDAHTGARLRRGPI